MKEDHLTWELIREKKLVDNEWIDFRESEWRFPDGLELGPFYTYHRKDYAVIAALDEEGRFLCVRQFRQGIRCVTTEFPAGGIEEGEDPLYCASREITEETGFVAGKIEKVGAVTATPGYCSEVITLFIGTELDSGDANPDQNEYIATVKMPLKEAVRMADAGEIEDSKTLVLIYKAARRLGL